MAKCALDLGFQSLSQGCFDYLRSDRAWPTYRASLCHAQSLIILSSIYLIGVPLCCQCKKQKEFAFPMQKIKRICIADAKKLKKNLLCLANAKNKKKSSNQRLKLTHFLHWQSKFF